MISRFEKGKENLKHAALYWAGIASRKRHLAVSEWLAWFSSSSDTGDTDLTYTLKKACKHFHRFRQCKQCIMRHDKHMLAISFNRWHTKLTNTEKQSQLFPSPTKIALPLSLPYQFHTCHHKVSPKNTQRTETRIRNTEKDLQCIPHTHKPKSAREKTYRHDRWETLEQYMPIHTWRLLWLCSTS